MTDYTDLVNWLRDNAIGVVSFRPKFIEAANAIEEQADRIAEIAEQYNSARLTPVPDKMLKDANDEIVHLRARIVASDAENAKLKAKLWQVTGAVWSTYIMSDSAYHDLSDKLRAYALISRREEFSDAADILEFQDTRIDDLIRQLKDAEDLIVKADAKQDDLRDKIRRLNSRITKMIAALRPFADAADDYFDDEDDEPAHLRMFLVGYLRAARAAMEGEDD